MPRQSRLQLSHRIDWLPAHVATPSQFWLAHMTPPLVKNLDVVETPLVNNAQRVHHQSIIRIQSQQPNLLQNRPGKWGWVTVILFPSPGRQEASWRLRSGCTSLEGSWSHFQDQRYLYSKHTACAVISSSSPPSSSSASKGIKHRLPGSAQLGQCCSQVHPPSPPRLRVRLSQDPARVERGWIVCSHTPPNCLLMITNHRSCISRCWCR